MQPISIDELKKVIALNGLPDEHLHWILDHSEPFEYEEGDIVAKTGEPADWMFFLTQGKIDYYMNVNGKLVYYFTFTNDSETGGVTGLLPYSRMKVYSGNSIAVERIRGLKMHKRYFQELEKLNPEFIQKLIGYMTERARFFATTKMQQEKVSALGNLAAGIAHELNNPASAITRISYELANRLFLNIELTEKMIRQNIDADHIKYLRDKIESKDNSSKQKLSVLQRMNNEDELMNWLEEKGLPADPVAEYIKGGYQKKIESERKQGN